MLRLFLVCLIGLLPISAQANCGGKNLWGALPEAQRKEITAAAQAQPYAQGLLWRATRKGRTITLFGSYHLPHAFTDDHLEMLLPLAEAADVTYFEMNASDTRRFEREMAQQPDLMFVTSGPTLPTLLSPEEWADVSAKMQARGFPPFLAAKMKPFFVSMMLGISPCALRTMQSGEHGIDRALAFALEEEGRATRSIEDYRTAAKLFDAFPPEKQMEFLRLALVQDVHPDDMLVTLFDHYIAEDVALIWEYTKALSLETGGPDAAEDFALFEDLLLSERNAAWLDVLSAAEEKHLLVVVGAAHLPGRNGVLNGLAEAGYAIERINFK